MICLDDAKAQLNITTPDDDALITSKIDAASQWIGLYTGILVPQYPQAASDAQDAAGEAWSNDNSDQSAALEAAYEALFSANAPLFVAYHLAMASIPAPVKEACRQLVAFLYQNREGTLDGATAQTMPAGCLDLLSPYRAYSF